MIAVHIGVPGRIQALFCVSQAVHNILELLILIHKKGSDVLSCNERLSKQ